MLSDHSEFGHRHSSGRAGIDAEFHRVEVLSFFSISVGVIAAFDRVHVATSIGSDGAGDEVLPMFPVIKQ